MHTYKVSDFIWKSTSGCLYETKYVANPGAPPTLTPEQLAAAAAAAAKKAGNQYGLAENVEGIQDLIDPYEPDASGDDPPLAKRTKMSTGEALLAELHQLKHKVWKCIGEGCTFACPSEAMLLDHWRNDCAQNSSRSADDKKPKLADLEITIKNRTIGSEKDDNK